MSKEDAAATVVLVHGGFVDGSGWMAVYTALKQKGYQVAIVQNPTVSLADDVAVTRRTIAGLEGPVVLVGHSYGGVVITEAGNDPKVAALVYIAAFAPDQGESVSSLIQNPPPGAPVPPILPPQDGFLFLDKSKFQASFAADVSADVAAFMADSQVPWGVEALGGAVTRPAWRTKPSWYLVATDDKMIPPDAQRAMSKRAGATVTETKGSHAVYVSQPQLSRRSSSRRSAQRSAQSDSHDKGGSADVRGYSGTPAACHPFEILQRLDPEAQELIALQRDAELESRNLFGESEVVVVLTVVDPHEQSGPTPTPREAGALRLRNQRWNA